MNTAASDGDRGLSSDTREVLQAELNHIRAKRTDASEKDLAGLALSGGGIRSASFALGVMQVLARRGWMQRFDYLSSVSGGGYIGASLSWLLSRRGVDDNPLFDTSASGFPFGTHRPGHGGESERPGRDPAALVTWLRRHGNYLAPDGQVTLASLVAVLLRGVLISLAVYLPLLTGLMWLLSVLGLFDRVCDTASTPWLLAGPCPDATEGGVLATGTTRAVVAVAWLGLAFVLVSLLYAVATRVLRSRWVNVRDGGATTGFSARRWFDIVLGAGLRVIVALAVLAALPLVHAWANDAGANGNAGVLGLLSAVAGIFSALAAFRPWRYVPRTLMVVVGALLLVFGTLLMAWSAAQVLPGPAVLGLSAVALALGAASNLNFVTVARYYRDRLMESFMPDLDANGMPRTDDGSHAADKLTLASLARDMRPYHLINTNVVLVDSEQPRYRLRGGDGFLLSPLWCGSDATGWQLTAEFIAGRLTLPTAMAVSGAAVNPHTGAGGKGITRSRMLSWLLMLLNVRLGFWAPNPALRRKAAPTPSMLYPGLGALLLGVRRETRPWLELTDGGHFENLGVYELLRRRCRLIVCCDGAADPHYHFDDLANAVQKARVDFGVDVDIPPAALADLVPTGSGRDAMRSERPATAKRGWLLAPIRYADDSEGLLVYLTTTFIGGLPADLVGYKLNNPGFPDEPTADQFFDECQFEAYRELGFRIASTMLADDETRGCQLLRDLQLAEAPGRTGPASTVDGD